MSISLKNFIIVGTFLFIAALGLFVSLSAPYISSGDELVYLTGALQVRDGDLPDAYMLQGYDDGPYLYPKIMLWWYESLGYYVFKSIFLFVLVIATGLGAYALFRLLFLPWIPALLLSVITLMPRFSAGTEIFGVFTFRESIGRASAVPLFLIGAGLLVHRMIERKSLWPIFGIFGIFIFLHPVTITLFAFISLIACAVTYALERTPWVKILRDIAISGVTFVLAGSYFFIEVFERLGRGIADEGVSSALYVQAIVFRNAWEFPEASLDWFRHMAIVSTFFIVALIIFYTIPSLQALRIKYQFPHAKSILVWGLTTSVSALTLTILLPGLNLYFMEHANAPYIFQQWSRISKFYYLGLFISLVPMVFILWQWYLESNWRFKKVAITFLVAIGILSSSFAFEIAQFTFGYKNFEKAYIPQMFSGIQNDTTANEYRETCHVLEKIGWTTSSQIISNNFAFRYYCKADLYVTLEEGAAYQQLTRADVVDWYDRFLAQRNALKDGDPRDIINFANNVEADFVILPRTSKYIAFDAFKDREIITTTKHIIINVKK